MGTDERDAIAATYDDFGRRWAHGTSPLYEDWALGIARDPDLLARLATLPLAQRQPNRVF
uniref:DUF2332 family protein n=1 Tax=Microbacterium sp. TaxID=51671 RepID=UPI0035B0681C